MGSMPWIAGDDWHATMIFAIPLFNAFMTISGTPAPLVVKCMQIVNGKPVYVQCAEPAGGWDNGPPPTGGKPKKFPSPGSGKP